MVHSTPAADTEGMTDTTIDKPSRRAWTSMLAVLPGCLGCGEPLRNTVAVVDGFCQECLERSRRANANDEDIGGEA
jgi:hypothetical protein